jgi:esterase
MQLAFQQYGSGRPLLILHGLFGSSDNWQTISRALGERFHVFAVDLRNHGRSPHSAEMSYPLMAEDLRELILRRLAVQVQHPRICILGHSMGGKVAMQFALAFPDHVEKLVVIDIAPKSYPPWHAEIFQGLLDLNLSKVSARAEADTQLAASVPDRVVRAFLLKNLARNTEGRFFWRFNLQALADQYSLLNRSLPAMGRFEGPALFVRGGHSDYIVDEDLPEIRKLFPKAILRTVPNAGHWVHSEQPQPFLNLVSDFLEGNSGD